MSESEESPGDKPFDPTPERLRKAREKGEIARSNDINIAASYAGLLIAGMLLGPPMLIGAAGQLQIMLDQPVHLADTLFSDSARPVMGTLFGTVLWYLIGWFAVPMVLVILAIIATRTFVVAPSKLKPKLSKISLIKNAKNKFGSSGLFEFAKSFVKLLIYSVVLIVLLWRGFDRLAGTMTEAPGAIAVLIFVQAQEVLSIVLIVAVLIGGADYLWQRMEHLRKNRMSHKEMRDEHKDAEGDPHLKQKRRARAQEIAMSQMASEVAGADVVIVNPTHFAVALRWERMAAGAPHCVAKGVDEMALRIREIAKEHEVPIHPDPPTARALHATVEVGEEIRVEHYGPVAAAIRFADHLRKVGS